MRYDFDGQTVLVTGYSSGIGLATAEHLASLGAKVVGACRTPRVASYGEVGTHFIPLDLSCRESLESFDRAVSNMRVDALVNCAGMFEPDSKDFSKGSWDKILQVNLSGTMSVSRSVSKGMISRGAGRIVNISSVAAFKARAGCVQYGTTKGAVLGLSRAMALDLAPSGILVNSVCPGIVKTAMVERSLSPQAISERASEIPSGKIASPEDIVPLISFLCSTRNTYMTGQHIVIDGGETVS